MAKQPHQAPVSTVPRNSWGEAARRFARTVIEARRKRQMTTRALAEQSGLLHRDILDIERGYPVDAQMRAAVARNLDLPMPDLEADPVYRLGQLLRQRRKQARLRFTQLARLSGLSLMTVMRAERGQCWPQHGTCATLLAVPELKLQEEDFAELMREMPAPAPSDSLPLPSPEPPVARPAPVPRSSTRQLAFTVCVYTDGSISFLPGRSLLP